jgi:hypothetical protein
MGNTCAANAWRSLKRFLESGHLAMGPHPADLAIGAQQGDTGGIVTAIFQATQTLQQDRHCVALGDHSNYSTHRVRFLLVI